MWIRSHTLSFSFSLSLTQTHTHTHMHRLTQILAVRHHNYSTNCCPARCRPVRIMSQHTNDSFGLLIMQFLWSAPLAHAKPQSLCGSSWRGESVEIIVCRSSLAALTSGRVPLCGATNRVVLKIPCRCGAARSVRYMLVHVCGALRHPHSSAQPGWWADQTGGWRERQASNNSCRSDPGRWTKQLLNREFSFFFPPKKSSCTFSPRQAKWPDSGELSVVDPNICCHSELLLDGE